MKERDLYYFILSVLNDSIELGVIEIKPEEKKEFAEHLAEEIERFYVR
jgi:hypothetical protein